MNRYDQTLTAEWYRQSLPPSVVADIAAEFEGLDVHQDFLAPHGGLVVLRRGPRRITIDTGPLGYLSIAAHGHATRLRSPSATTGRTSSSTRHRQLLPASPLAFGHARDPRPCDRMRRR